MPKAATTLLGLFSRATEPEASRKRKRPQQQQDCEGAATASRRVTHSGDVAAVAEEETGCMTLALYPAGEFHARGDFAPCDPATQDPEGPPADPTACVPPPLDGRVASPRSLPFFEGQPGDAGVIATASKTLGYLRDAFAERGEFCHSDADRGWLYDAMLQLSKHAVELCRSDARRTGAVVAVKGSAAIIGDLHGDFEDMLFFVERVTVMGDIRLSPHSLVFLGDYVDRGRWGVEVCAFVMALLCLAPQKVVLLRGNHDDPSVNSSVSDYAQASFRYQCAHFASRSQKLGDALHIACNRLFKVLPLAAILDDRVFCSHGGIPRYMGGPDDRLAVLCHRGFPELPIVHPQHLVPNGASLQQKQMLYAWDLMWADPIGEAEDAGGAADPPEGGAPPGDGCDGTAAYRALLRENGFGPNARGGKTVTYSSDALSAFLDKHGFACLVRGHQERLAGVRLSHRGRLLSVFSTSGYCNHSNSAGAVVYHADTAAFHYISKALRVPPVVPAR